MKRFKKIYIEITNSCNLNCKFCIGNSRKIKFMAFDEFKIILNKVREYTDYLYFHVLGEPLLHPDINKFIDYACNMGFKINLTTNGYLIDRIKCNRNIRQVNISLHSYDNKYGVSLDNYLSNVFDVIDCIPNTFFSLRMWTNSEYCNSIFNYIDSYYNVLVDRCNFDKFKVYDNVFLSQSSEFVWPDLNNDYYSCKGRCYGLIDHIGILTDGTVVPCCLDSTGIISLGNIFDSDLNDIINTDRVSNIIGGFKSDYKCEELCRHCSFLENKKGF